MFPHQSPLDVVPEVLRRLGEERLQVGARVLLLEVVQLLQPNLGLLLLPDLLEDVRQGVVVRLGEALDASGSLGIKAPLEHEISGKSSPTHGSVLPVGLVPIGGRGGVGVVSIGVAVLLPDPVVKELAQVWHQFGVLGILAGRKARQQSAILFA